MIVVSDTSPISALIRLGQVELLPQVFGQVVIPPAVKTELSYLQQFGFDLQDLWAADWLSIQAAQNQSLINQLSLELDVGEVAAIALAQELSPQFLVIDEKRGRTVAERLGIPVVGLLGILILAKKQGLLPAIRPLILELKGIDFFVSDALANRILQRLGEPLI